MISDFQKASTNLSFLDDLDSSQHLILIPLEKQINTNSKYSISLASSKTSFIDSTFYDIKIISDSHPFISIKNNSAENGKIIFLFRIMDLISETIILKK